eukprot:c27273_g1_i1 orf=406-1920(-)
MLPLRSGWTVPPLCSPHFSSYRENSTSSTVENKIWCGRCSFFGPPHVLCNPGFPGTPLGYSNLPRVTARIKWRKDVYFDKVIERQKKLKIATKIKELLVKQPGMVMSLRDLGKYRRSLGLQGRRRCIALLRKFPSVFEVFEEGVYALYFRLTPEAEQQFLEEQNVREEVEFTLVEKIRKLLMMSVDRRILLEKIGHIRRDLGLPEDFATDFVHKYPQFFKVVETGGGASLELTAWDSKLAVTAYEKQQEEEARKRETFGEETISGRIPKFKKIDLPKGYSLSRKDKLEILTFQEIPFISPYEDFSSLDPSSPAAEKHAVAVVHEILSLTLEKKTLVDHLTHFRRDFKFSQRVRGMLIRHPEFFYVSLKGDRDSVFLREAYSGSNLIVKDPLVLAKEKLEELVAKGSKFRMSTQKREEEDDGGDSDTDDWSDADAEDADATSDVTSSGQLFGGGDDNEEKKMQMFPCSPDGVEFVQYTVRMQTNKPLNCRDNELATVSQRPRERW